nr:ATP-binding cassette domain-containing protein [Enterobacter ludwigii]
MTLHPSEVVAFTGKSGSGKSTLVKLILGIHIPDEGTIRTFGIPQTHPDYFQVRRRIGTVLQDDHLFRGSIADSIIFFSKDRNQERMIQCARLAQRKRSCKMRHLWEEVTRQLLPPGLKT